MDNNNPFKIFNSNWFNFLKENKDIIIGDIKTTIVKLKSIKLIELFLIFLLLPFTSVLISIYIVFVIFYIIIFIVIFFKKYYYKYELKKKFVKPITCEIEKSIFSNYIILFIIIVYKNTPKIFAFLYVYNCLKIIKEPKKIEIKKIIIIFLRILIRIILLLVFSYSVFIIKNTIEIYLVIKKCLNQNYDDYKTLSQIILFDIAAIFYCYGSLLIKKKKIKFLKNKIKLNMKPNQQIIKKIKEFANFKLSISNEKSEILKKAFNELMLEHSDLRYIELKSTIENNNEENIEKEIIKEKKPHTSMVINVDDKTNLLLRATTSKKINISNDNFMKTHTPSTGILDSKKIENRTNIIEAKKEDVKIIFNEKLLKNLQKDSGYINYYNQGLINSLENPTYLWDKGDLQRDWKYKNLIDKINNDEILKNNLKIKKCMDIIVDTYNNNIKNFKNTTNNKVFDAVIKIILSENSNIDQTTTSLILQLIKEE